MLTFVSKVVLGQTEDYNNQGSVPSAASFLAIPVDIRGSGMGNLSVATQMDANAGFSNPARIALFGTNELSELAITYNPLSPLMKDIRLLTFSGYTWVSPESYIGMTLQFFSFGQVTFFDAQGNESQQLMPNEMALGGFYTRRFGERLALSLSFKGILSNATGGVQYQGEATRSGTAIAADIGLAGSIATGNNEIDYGVAFNNIGTKMSYGGNTLKSFLPMSIKAGGGYRVIIDDDNYIFGGLELSKSLLPSIGAASVNQEMGLVSSIGSSFSTNASDYSLHVGAEGKFSGSFFLRAGYNMENRVFGRNSYGTLGLGYIQALGVNNLRMDGAFNTSSHPFNNTFKIGLAFILSE